MAGEYGAGEDEKPAAVVGRVVQQIGLQTQPELQALVELGGLRCRVCVVEGVFVGLGGFCTGITPDR